jgi:acyl-CoA reductase-like NAD-dependent aldehyde dehydrogenase
LEKGSGKMDITPVINGERIESIETYTLYNKYSGEEIAVVNVADEAAVTKAIDVAEATFENDVLTPYERYTILSKASALINDRKEEFARDLVLEVGKTIREARVEVDRAVQTLLLSAEEAKRLTGEQIPINASPGSENKFAYYVRAPLGVVCAITPFNVPLNLACHKLGPAIAAGNTVVWKPASNTPINAFKLLEVLTEAGLPKGYVNLVYGSGSKLGSLLLNDQRIAKYTFTGSPSVGKWIKENSGLRSVSLELGNNSPNIVHHDADIEKAAEKCVRWGLSLAGQACISVQRIYVHQAIKEDFTEAMVRYASKVRVGDPMDEDTDMGPLISGGEADRVLNWIEEAREQGARILIGGEREGNAIKPTIIDNVDKDMKIICQEIFGPVITLIYYSDIDEAIKLANDSEYGLQSAVFTKDIKTAMYVSKKLKTGGVVINDGSTYRADLMPYGGIKNSGLGKEGPAYAIKEMTYVKPIIFDLS